MDYEHQLFFLFLEPLPDVDFVFEQVGDVEDLQLQFPSTCQSFVQLLDHARTPSLHGQPFLATFFLISSKYFKLL